MKNLNKKQKIILTLLGIGIIALVALGATYAYFLAVVEPGEKAPVDIITDTTDNLLFDVEDNINLAINKYNFGPGNGDLTSHAKATATLRANSTDNTATYNYYLYFNIESNEFVYTTEDNKPEIILTITDPNGNPVTEVTGLTYVTAGSVSGFDITTASGLFTIASNYEITSNSSTTDTLQEWNFTATFINLDSDQNDNTGKSMNGTIKIRRHFEGQLLADYIKGLYTEDGVNNLYYHDGVGTYTNADQETGDSSYRYAGGDYIISPQYADTYTQINNALIGYNCDGVDKAVGGFYCPASKKPYYFLKYDTKEEKTKYSTYQAVVNQAITDGYIINKNVNNFVCFGSESSKCPYNNLYRIIGVFGNKVKLIKYDYATTNDLGTDGDATNEKITIGNYYRGNQTEIDSFYWNNENYDTTYNSTNYWNVWSYSSLNLKNLNDIYLNSLGEKWNLLIADNNWNISGATSADLYGTEIAKKAFSYELGENMLNTFPNYKGKIGLIYASDYYYSALPQHWKKAGNGTRALNDYRYAKYENWMHMGITEWIISPISGTSDTLKTRVGYIAAIGNLTYSTVKSKYAVRPTFYLEDYVTYASGDGTIENPIRIGM